MPDTTSSAWTPTASRRPIVKDSGRFVLEVTRGGRQRGRGAVAHPGRPFYDGSMTKPATDAQPRTDLQPRTGQQ